MRVYRDNFSQQSTGARGHTSDEQWTGTSRGVYAFELCTLDPSRLRAATNGRDAFICFINSGGHYNSRYPPWRNNKRDRGLSLSPREGPMGPAQWAQWLAIIASSRRRHGLLPTSCQFECPIGFTLEAPAGVYEGPRDVSNARSFSYRRSLSWGDSLSLFLSRSLSRESRWTGDARFRCEPIALLRTELTVTDSARPARYGSWAYATFNVRLWQVLSATRDTYTKYRVLPTALGSVARDSRSE